MWIMKCYAPSLALWDSTGHSRRIGDGYDVGQEAYRRDTWMTVHELIESLKTMPQHVDVVFMDQCGAMDVEEVRFVDEVQRQRLIGRIQDVHVRRVEIS
jgi:hypothetical protein